jgi:ribonuclease Z
MLKSFDLRDRQTPLDLFGPPGTRDVLGIVGRLIGRLGYEFAVTEMEAGDDIEFDGYVVQAFNVRHRGPAFGYTLVEDDRPGRFDADLAQRLGVPFGPDFGRLQRGETVNGVRAEQVVGAPRAGRRIVLSGDTAPSEMLRAAAERADLLVHEATFTEDERERAAQTRHSTARQAAEIAAEAEVRLLALTHLSTRYGGREIRDEARAVFPNTVVPRDFDTVEVPFAEKGEPELVRWQGRLAPESGASPDPLLRS